MKNWDIIGKSALAICGAIFFGWLALIALNVYFPTQSAGLPFSGKSIAGAFGLGTFGAWAGWCIADLVTKDMAYGGAGYAIARLFFWR